MDQTVFVIVGLVVAIVLGWFFGSRPVAELKGKVVSLEQEAKEGDNRYLRTFAELEATKERARLVDELSGQLAVVRDERDAQGRENAMLKANAVHFEEQKKLLIEAREALLKEFQNTGNAVLGKAQEAFLKAASERFGHAEKASEAKIKALLEPVGKTLESYEKQVKELESKRVDAFGHLYGQIAEMQRGQELVRVEAERLGSSLRAAPKASGRWGELQVKNVLEKCGLSEHYDFVAEKSVTGEEGRLRPDFVVDIPGGKKIIIDSKNIWRSYDASLNAETTVEKERLLKDHSDVLRKHIRDLSQKSYSSEFEGSSDYVVLFIPGEHLLYSALEQDDKLWNIAFESNVLLATPTNLVAICRTVATIWQQEGLTQNAREIGKIGSNLYDSLAKTQADIASMGEALQRAVGKYNEFTKTYDGNVLSRARMLKEKHIAIKKREVEDDVPQIEAAPRYNAGDIAEEQGGEV